MVSTDDLVITVLWHTTEVYHRADSTFQPLISTSRLGRNHPVPERKFSDEPVA